MSRAPRKGDPLVAVGYVRVSDKERQELGPEAQRRALEAWSASGGVRLVEVFEDRTSGGVKDEENEIGALERRVGLRAAMAALRPASAGVLLVYRRDRLARDVLLAGAIEREVTAAGARVVSTQGEGTGSDAPADVFTRQIMDAVAQLERGLIRARVKAALAVKRGRHERVGSVPYGYQLGRDGVHLDPLLREQVTVARARELSRGGLPLRAVGAQLLREGHRPRRGGAWHPQTIANLIKESP